MICSDKMARQGERGHLKLLLFGSMGEIGPVVRDDLIGNGVDTVLVDFPQNTFSDEPGYRRKLLKSIREHRPDTVLPVGCAIALARFKECPPAELTDIPMIPVAPSATLELLDSKVRCSQLAASLGIPQPKIFPNPEDAPEASTVFKLDKSFGGSGVYRPKNMRALKNLMSHFDGKSFLIEEYIPGDDISVDCVRGGDFFNAQCYRSVQKHQGQGPSVVREIIQCPEAEEYTHTILDSVDYFGVCGLDFRRDREGRIFFLECNPRFCGGISTQIDSGFDIPLLLLSLSSRR